MAAYYVKFMRGTPRAYEIATKNSDTLYFITEPGEDVGKLYLGEVLIAGGSSVNGDFNINNIKDIVISENANNGSVLTYDKENKIWVDKNIEDLIAVDDTTIELNALGALGLKNFGSNYYRFVAEVTNEDGSVEPAHYEPQIVDAEHPWSSGLEPRVVEDDGKFYLGWYEPNTSIIDGVNTQISALQNEVDELKENTYTKAETETRISEAIVNADHLDRVIVDSLEEAEQLANTAGGNQYIYMVPNENGSYDEYILITDPSTGEQTLEKAGSWEVDLSDYVKKDEEFIRSTSVDFQVINGNLELNIDYVSQDEKAALEKSIADLQAVVGGIDFNNYVTTTEFNNRLEIIEDAITWGEMQET